ncbi:MAG: caspase family protein [Bradyrhizobium sp.]
MIRRQVLLAAATVGAILSMVLAPDCALAEKRVALIVGNSTYQTVPQLPNPSRDAGAVAKMFKDAGFDSVDVQLNVGNLEFKRSIRKFEAMADQADIAVVYYAGHGLEISGTNYLIPIDARLASDRDADDEAISLERLVSSTDGAKRLRLVILDACRDNPFVTKMRRERTVASRAVTSGLGKVEPTSTDTLIAYAAKAGSTADDGDGEHSPFTSALLKNLTVPGLDVRLAFGRVRDDVLKSTGNRQEPFVYGSLGGETMALVPQIAKPVDSDAEARVDYELTAQIGTREAWDSFLASHPTGLYANLARAQNSKLAAAQQSHAKADDARRDAEQQAAVKAEELRKQLEDTKTRQSAEDKQKLSEQAKKDLEEANKQVELAQQQAETARQQVAEAKRQAIAEAQLQVEQAKRAAQEDAEKIAALTPGQTPQAAPLSPPQIGQADIARLLQAHLKRVGCNSGNVDGNWDDSSRKALELFNKNAKTQFDIKLASLDALDAVRNKPDRVCPLICAKGQRAEGDRCVQIGCGSGTFLNSSGSCEKRREPAPRARTATYPSARPRYPAPQPQSGSSGACGLDASGHRQANVRTC